ncbi:hypothetical protein SK128_014283, partial [Halocaridina rubra]
VDESHLFKVGVVFAREGWVSELGFTGGGGPSIPSLCCLTLVLIVGRREEGAKPHLSVSPSMKRVTECL